MIPREHTLIHVESELVGARAWAERHRVPLEWLPDGLELRATLSQPETGDEYFLRARVGDYRELPPAWSFTDSNWKADPIQTLFPRPNTVTSGGASIFHTQPVICAPFNRLAYKFEGVQGPHGDWGGPANWLAAGKPNEVRADSLGDMLSVIYQHFLVTRGRMA